MFLLTSNEDIKYSTNFNINISQDVKPKKHIQICLIFYHFAAVTLAR